MIKTAGVNQQLSGDGPRPSKLAVNLSYKGKQVPQLALVDTGNLIARYGGCAISEQLAQQLKIPISPEGPKIGTADKNSYLNVIGRCRGLRVTIPATGRQLIINPVVIRGFSIGLNLGLKFLMKHGCALKFGTRRDDNSIRFGNDKPVQLVGQMGQTEKEAGQPRLGRQSRPQDQKQHKERSRDPPPTRQEGMPVRVSQVTKILAGTMKMVQGTVENKEAQLLYITPVVGPGEHPCLAQQTISPSQDGQVTICMVNLSHEDVVVPRGGEVGRAIEVEEQLPARSDATKLPNYGSVNATNDRDPNKDRQKKLAKVLAELEVEENKLLQANPGIKKKVIGLIDRYLDVFSDESHQYGETDRIEFRVKLTPDARPVKTPVRPLNPDQKKSLRDQLDSWQREGVIEASNSPWASPLVPVRKKDGTTRWAVDYRMLNKQTIPDSYPVPLVSESLERLQGCRVFSSFDASSAYNCIRVAEESKPLLAFISPFGLFQFRRMPFGSRNAGATYCRFISEIINEVSSEYIQAYLDDVLESTPDLSTHVREFEKVLAMHLESGILLKAKKCKIFQQQISFLGHRISEEGVAMEPSYVSRILEWPAPKNQGELRSFLGFTAYYKEFLPRYSQLTNRMNSMRGKNAEFKWDKQVQTDFEAVKKEFSREPLRAYPDFSKDAEPFQVTTDWSATNRAAILSQVQDGKERLIAATGRKNNEHQKNYNSAKGELHSLLLAIRKWSHILRYKKFRVNSDSGAIRYYQNYKPTKACEWRWMEELQDYHFDIVHRPGKFNVNADQLSRRQHMPDKTEQVKGVAGLVNQVNQLQDVKQQKGTQIPAGVAFNREKLICSQHQDPVLQQVGKWVKSNIKPNLEVVRGQPEEMHRYVRVLDQLKIIRGALCRVAPETDQPHKPGDKPRIQLLVPPACREDIFAWVHRHPISAHFGTAATVERTLRYFYWPGLRQDIAERIRQCNICINKVRKISTKEGKHVPRTVGFPLEKVYCDLIGPYQTTKEGYKYALTIQDGFSRWVHAIPLRSKEAVEVVDALYQGFVCLFGAPMQIHTDNGREFQNKIWSGLLKRMRVLETKTPSYNPSSNQVERFHRCLNDIIRTYKNPDWARVVPGACFAFNSKVNAATGETPSRIFFGREVRLPLDLITELPEQEQREVPDYLKRVLITTEEAYRQVRKQQEMVVRRNATSYEGNTHEEAKPGALCWYYAPALKPGTPGKWTNHWVGPYQVQDRPGKALVTLKAPGTESPVFTTNLSRIRPYHGEPPLVRAGQVPDIEWEDNSQGEGEEVRLRGPQPTPQQTVVVYGEPSIMIRDLKEKQILDETGGQGIEHEADDPPEGAGPREGDVVPRHDNGSLPSGPESPQEGTALSPPNSKRPITDSESDNSALPRRPIKMRVPDPAPKRGSEQDGTARKKGAGCNRPSAKQSSSRSGSKRELTADSNTDPEPVLKEARPIRARARQIAADRRMARQLELSTSEEGELYAMGGCAAQASHDLRAARTVVIPAGQERKVNVKMKTAIPGQHALLPAAQPGLEEKGLRVAPIPIKAGQAQSASISLLNTNNFEFVIRKGQRIALAHLCRQETD